MAEAFKDIFNQSFLERFANTLLYIVPHIESKVFIRQVMDSDWEARAYKQRVNHIATVLKQYLPADYKKAVSLIIKLLKKAEKNLPDFSIIDDKNFQLLDLEYGAILDSYIGQYGLHDYETSIKAIEILTQFTSCEFCVRPFIIQYPDKMMNQMLVWSRHKHWGVRRLASEGCRPRLPWGVSLPELKANPKPIIPILENLKNDPARFVRLSVANNLNDIAKDNPDTVLTLAKKWHGQSTEIDWVIKHGCRTLLKQGSPKIMKLLGFDAGAKNIQVSAFKVNTPKVKIGDYLAFTFTLENCNTQKRKIRLEYAIYYQKANGTLARKVHKISEKEYPEDSIAKISRKHSFKEVTTRKLHLGQHQVAVIINGKEMGKLDFKLIK